MCQRSGAIACTSDHARKICPEMREGRLRFWDFFQQHHAATNCLRVRIEKRMSFKDAFSVFRISTALRGQYTCGLSTERGLFQNQNTSTFRGQCTRNCLGSRSPRLANLTPFSFVPKGQGWIGRWLGPLGPQIHNDIMDFLRTRCSVHGAAGRLSAAKRRWHP